MRISHHTRTSPIRIVVAIGTVVLLVVVGLKHLYNATAAAAAQQKHTRVAAVGRGAVGRNACLAYLEAVAAGNDGVDATRDAALERGERPAAAVGDEEIVVDAVAANPMRESVAEQIAYQREHGSGYHTLPNDVHKPDFSAKITKTL